MLGAVRSGFAGEDFLRFREPKTTMAHSLFEAPWGELSEELKDPFFSRCRNRQ